MSASMSPSGRWLATVGCAVAAIAATAFAQAEPVSGATPAATGSGLGLSMIFTAFFVMLGPVKLVGPFARLTSSMTVGDARKTATQAFGFACAGGLVAAGLGQSLLVNWRISLPVLHLAAGLVLLLVALKAVLEQYEPAANPPAPAPPPRNLALSPLTFPTILTPYGIAVFILLLAGTRDTTRDVSIIVLFLAVMVLNWGVMWFARAIVAYGGIVLAIAGAVLGVLQVALALQITVNALRSLHVFAAL